MQNYGKWSIQNKSAIFHACLKCVMLLIETHFDISEKCDKKNHRNHSEKWSICSRANASFPINRWFQNYPKIKFYFLEKAKNIILIEIQKMMPWSKYSTCDSGLINSSWALFYLTTHTQICVCQNVYLWKLNWTIYCPCILKFILSLKLSLW